MTSPALAPYDAALDAWEICARVTVLLVEHLPERLWAAPLPGMPRRTFRSVAAHLHNSRGLWIKALGTEHGVSPPPRVKPAAVSRADLLAALGRSSRQVAALLAAGTVAGGRFPGGGGAFVFGAIPRDVVRFTAYAVAHESHHRGQIVMAARQAGHRLQDPVIVGLWQWSARLREARSGR